MIVSAGLIVLYCLKVFGRLYV